MADGAHSGSNAQAAQGDGRWRELRLTVRDYDRMADAGLFAGPSKYELWDGRLMMAPQPGGPHMAAERGAVMALARALVAHKLDQAYLIQTGGGLEIGAHNLRGPDIMVLKAPMDSDRRPVGEDVALLIEIAHSSLEDDLTEKREKYAAAGVPEYWVIDVAARRRHAFRDPRNGDYPDPEVLEGDSTIAPMFAPGLALRLADMF